MEIKFSKLRKKIKEDFGIENFNFIDKTWPSDELTTDSEVTDTKGDSAEQKN